MEAAQNISNTHKKNLQMISVWVFLLLAVAGTFMLTKKLGESGENAASVFFGGASMRKIYLYQERAEPTSITAETGDEIVFMVLDESKHNIAQERSSKRGVRLESGEFGAGESYSLSFAEPGLYSFYDRMNLDIRISITVR